MMYSQNQAQKDSGSILVCTLTKSSLKNFESTSRFHRGYGPTYIDGKVIDATFLHLKEWIDAIRGFGTTSCGIDVGFEEAVTFNLANLAYEHRRPVHWDKVNEKVIIE